MSSGGEAFKVDDGGTAYFCVNTSTDVATFEAGNVGIGTLTPGTTPRRVVGGDEAFKVDNGTAAFFRVNTATGVTSFDTGKVGIGTTSPTEKLHVEGNIYVSGNINAKYQDVAEWVPSKLSLASGTVVIIDPQERNRVLPAAQPYDTRVAGVVSDRPGLLLGEAGEDKVKVAHSGRVKVKADAEYGAIAVGDLLVTSPTPGHAMRSAPVEVGGVAIHRPGTLVGKALEPLAEGQGEILVLLTLQ